MNIKSLLSNKTAQNAGWIMAGRIAQMCVSMVVGLLTARYLGPANYGLINYAGAYTAFFMAFCTLGINSLLVKEFVDNPGREGVVIGTSLLLRVISSFLSAILIFVIVSFVDAGEAETKAVIFLCSLGMIFHAFEVFNFWFQSKLQSKITAIATFVAYCVTALYRIVLMLLDKNVVFFAFATSVDYICLAIILYTVYRKKNGGKLKFSWSYGKTLLSKSHHFILSSMMVAIYGQTDKLMLKQMLGTTEVGYYSTAVAICTMWTFVLTAIIDSIYPSIMQVYGKDDELFKKRNKQLYFLVFYISILISVLFLIFAPLVLKLLYGEEFIAAATPLRIVTWYIAFSYLGVARNAWLVCKNAQKNLKYIYMLGAIGNIILNLIFIPPMGASGAALASLISQILTSIVLPLFFKSMRENSLLILEAITFQNIKPTKQIRKKFDFKNRHEQ